MKKTLSIFLALLVVTSVAFANTDVPASTSGLAVTKKGSVFKVFYKTETTADIKVIIYNEKNKILFSEVVRNSDGFIRPYNFSNLPEGNYKIEVIKGADRKTEILTYGEVKTPKTGHVIQLTSQNEKYLLAIANKGNDVINLRILDKYNKVVFELSETISGDYARLLNLQKLSEKALLEVSDSNGIITKYTF